MPNITVTIAMGRSTEQLEKFVEAVTEAAVETLEIDPERVGIQIVELPADRMARGGQLLSERRKATSP